jgi:hypothetical protein
MERGSVLPILEKWRLLKELYSTVSNKVVLGNLESEWFNQDNGVNQGCILSPSLFSVMMKDLTDRLSEHKYVLQQHMAAQYGSLRQQRKQIY